MHSSHFANIRRAFCKARDSPDYYHKAPCTMQALVTGMQFFQCTLMPFTIDAQSGSQRRFTEQPDLRECALNLLKHFAVERFENYKTSS
jgi:hypothetical protein